MSPTVEELSYAIFCLGSGEPPTEHVPQAVLNRLAEFNMVRLSESSAPELTNYGWTTYEIIIRGEIAGIPEFQANSSGDD
jgi:hypothetical protein